MTTTRDETVHQIRTLKWPEDQPWNDRSRRISRILMVQPQKPVHGVGSTVQFVMSTIVLCVPVSSTHVAEDVVAVHGVYFLVMDMARGGTADFFFFNHDGLKMNTQTTNVSSKCGKMDKSWRHLGSRAYARA